MVEYNTYFLAPPPECYGGAKNYLPFAPPLDKYLIARLQGEMSDSQRCSLKLCLIKSELDINVYNLENYLYSLVVSSHTCPFLLQVSI